MLAVSLLLASVLHMEWATTLVGFKFEPSWYYLWAFPIQQALAHYSQHGIPYVNALVAALLTTCGAFVNHFVVTAHTWKIPQRARRQKGS